MFPGIRKRDLKKKKNPIIRYIWEMLAYPGISQGVVDAGVP